MNFYEKVGLHVCRACLTLSKEVQLIFEVNQSLVSMLHALSIELNSADNLPKHICMPCFEKLNMAYAFIEKFKSSQRLIQETVSSDEYVIEKEIHENFQIDFEYMDETTVIDYSEVEPIEKQVGLSTNHKDNTLEMKCTGGNPIRVRMDLFYQESAESPLETPKVEEVSGAQNFDDHVFSYPDGKYIPNLYYCQFCKTSLSNFELLCSHLIKHENQTNGPISCDYCDGPSKTFKNMESFTLHLCINHKVIFSCQFEHCSSRKYENFVSHYKHMKRCLKKLKLRNVFLTPSVVSKELPIYPWEKIQTNNFTCPYCAKTCLYLSQFRYHLWTHFFNKIGTSPFTCSTCQKKFACKAYRKSHYRQSLNCRPKQQEKKAKPPSSSSTKKLSTTHSSPLRKLESKNQSQ